MKQLAALVACLVASVGPLIVFSALVGNRPTGPSAQLPPSSDDATVSIEEATQPSIVKTPEEAAKLVRTLKDQGFHIEERTDLPPDASLGLELFYDTILSDNGKVRCATCHLPEKGYSSGGLPPALGGGTLARRAPSLLNRASGKSFFWDGRAKSLEEQALLPIVHRDEMGNRSMSPVLGRLRQSQKYRKMFDDAYPQWGIVDFTVGMALAAFETRLKTRPTRLDTYMSGTNSLSLKDDEARGLALFRGEGKCYKCHTYPDLTDESFHNTGIGYDRREGFFRDLGRYNVTRDQADVGKFKTPGLRSVSLSGPYMHDASLETLEDVIDFYDRGGVRNPRLDREMKPLRLSDRDKADLLAFLKSI